MVFIAIIYDVILLTRHFIIPGINILANTSTGIKLKYYIQDTLNDYFSSITDQMFISFNNMIINFIKTDSIRLFCLIFKLNDFSNEKKIRSKDIINYINYINNNINKLLIDNYRQLLLNKDIIKINKIIYNIIFNDIELNNFLNYLIKYTNNDLKINLYYNYNNNLFYIEINFYILNQIIVRKFTYEQLKNNLYKIKLCLINNNRKKYCTNQYYYNNIIDLYINYFINKLQNNFILLYENQILNICNLIESSDMLDDNPYNYNGIIDAIYNFKSKCYENILIFKNKIIDYTYKIGINESVITSMIKKKIEDNVIYNVKRDVKTDIKKDKKSIFGFLKKQKGGNNIIENNIRNNILYNNIIDNINNIPLFINKYKYYYNNILSNSSILKPASLILTYDINLTSNIDIIPSIRLNFFNQINKNIEEMDKINIDDINIEIHKSFIDKLIINLNFNNIIDEINLNYKEYYKFGSIIESYIISSDESKIESDIKLKNNFIKNNFIYVINLYILYDEFSIKYNIDYYFEIIYLNDDINYNKNKIEKLIKKRLELIINDFLYDFNNYISNDDIIFNFFIKLLNEKCKIKLVINNKNIYLLIENNDKKIILDCFDVYILFSFKIILNDHYFKINNYNFINTTLNDLIIPNESVNSLYKYNYNSIIKNINNNSKNIFNELYIIYSNRYNDIYNDILSFFKYAKNTKQLSSNNELGLYINDKNGIIDFSIPKTLTLSRVYKSHTLINIYNRDIFNFLKNNKNIKDINLYINNNIVYINYKDINNKKYSYTLEEIKFIFFDLFNFINNNKKFNNLKLNKLLIYKFYKNDYNSNIKSNIVSSNYITSHYINFIKNLKDILNNNQYIKLIKYKFAKEFDLKIYNYTIDLKQNIINDTLTNYIDINNLLDINIDNTEINKNIILKKIIENKNINNVIENYNNIDKIDNIKLIFKKKKSIIDEINKIKNKIKNNKSNIYSKNIFLIHILKDYILEYLNKNKNNDKLINEIISSFNIKNKIYNKYLFIVKNKHLISYDIIIKFINDIENEDFFLNNLLIQIKDYIKNIIKEYNEINNKKDIINEIITIKKNKSKLKEIFSNIFINSNKLTLTLKKFIDYTTENNIYLSKINDDIYIIAQNKFINLLEFFINYKENNYNIFFQLNMRNNPYAINNNNY